MKVFLPKDTNLIDDSHWLLMYNKLRMQGSRCGGLVRVDDATADYCDVRLRTLKERLVAGLEKGYYRKLSETVYQLVSLYKIDPRKVLAKEFSEEQLLAINWHNIGDFRAGLGEAAIQSAQNYQAWKKKRDAYRPTITLRDKVYEPKRKQKKPRPQRQTKEQRREKKAKWKAATNSSTSTTGAPKGSSGQLVSCTYAAAVNNISPATACRYRRRVPGISYTPVFERIGEYPYHGYDERDYLNEKAAAADNLAEHGRYFVHKGQLFFQGISVRRCTATFSKVKKHKPREQKETFPLRTPII